MEAGIPVLVAEDESSTLEMLRHLLSGRGYEVLTAATGTQAWEIMQAENAPRLLLLDWQMPGMTGGELCRRLREDDRLRSCYVIILTGQDEHESMSDAFGAGADDYIAKPFDLDELFSRLAVGERMIRMQAELNENLRNLEAAKLQYHQLFDLESDALFLVEQSSGRIREVNVAAQRLYGYDREEFLAMTISDLSNEPEKTRQVLKDRVEYIPLRHHRKKSGQVFVVEVTVSYFSWQGLNVHLSAVRDISERLALEESLKNQNSHLESAQQELELTNLDLIRSYAELKETQSKILQQEKMVSIGQLAAGMAHEINNPVGFIISNLNSLKKYGERIKSFIEDGLAQADQPGLAELITRKKVEFKVDVILDDMDDLISESLDGANRVKRLVMDLKSFSRVDEVEYKHADINECVESTLNIVWNELKYKAKVVKTLADLPQIKCYPQQLNQVFMNLLVNAGQAIEKQGTITIITREVNGFIEVSVSDTGCGIPPEIRERIFEPFFTTKEVGKGTGLGLSITYDIVKKHGGEIIVESESGAGTTFTVRLPVVEGR